MQFLTPFSIYCTDKKNNRQLPNALVPKVMVVVIIDGCSYETSTFVQKYYINGLRYITGNATIFTQAYYAHGLPTTAPGHTTFITGVHPKTHGIVGNNWPVNDKKQVAYSCKQAQDSLCMVDTLTDQMQLGNNQAGKVFVYSCSTKKRAARALAGELGTAIWFDEKTGLFTSTQKHNFIEVFNKKKNHIKTARSFAWHSQYSLKAAQYRLPDVGIYTHASAPSMINKKYAIDRGAKKPYETFVKTPLADALVVEMAVACIQDFYQSAAPTDRLALFISLSAHDKLAHLFGQYKYEPLDSMYSADKSLQKVVNQLHAKFRKQDIVWVFSADHGGPAIIDDLNDRGLTLAKRYDTKTIIAALNNALSTAIGIDGIVCNVNTPFVYFSHKIFNSLAPEKQKEVFAVVKKSLLENGSILNAWPISEISSGVYDKGDVRSLLANQIFEGRCGDMVFLVRPYTLITDHLKGTSHETPYEQDTHVPLMIYWPGNIEKKIITDRCEMVQVAPTLAQLFGVPRPSASLATLLRGINEKEVLSKK
jgi:predicted AlkP superfamily pyrophosphatase or phosphodiesterase